MKPDPSLEALRRRFAAPGPAPDPAACPPAERIWDASHGALAPEEARAVVDHLHACPACAEEWRIAASEAIADERPTRRLPGLSAWTALAATLVVAMGLFFLLRPGPATETPSFRADAERSIRSLVPDGASLPRDAFLLRWEPVEDEALYDVRVDSQDLTPVHEARGLAVSELLVPTEAFAEVRDGSKLVWRVEAHLVDGTSVRSGALLVRVQ